MVNSEIPDFEDFDKESQAILKNLYENNRILNFENPNVRSLTKLEEIKTTQSFDEISNEIGLSTPFGKDSVFYRELREIITGQIPKL